MKMFFMLLGLIFLISSIVVLFIETDKISLSCAVFMAWVSGYLFRMLTEDE